MLDGLPIQALPIAIFGLVVFVISSLFGLSIAFPWIKRTRKEFLKSADVFGSAGEKLDSLLNPDETAHIRYVPSKVYLSVVIPAMNEEERLPVMLDECMTYLTERSKLQSSFTYEVIIVDDGSTDNTAQLGANWGKRFPTIKVLKMPENRGKGGAVRFGVLHSSGQMILFVDADGATRFTDFTKLERSMLQITGEPFDESCPVMAIGSRAHLEKQSVAERSFLRTILMHGFHILVHLFTVKSVKDTQCGFKLFSRSLAARIFPVMHIERWAFDVELLYLCERWNTPIEEVSVEWHEIDGSKITPFWSALQMGRDLLLIWFRYQTYDEDTDYIDDGVEGFDLDKVCNNIKIDIVNESEDKMTLEFDLVHVNAPIANSLRRVLIAEVPTMAIEKIYLYQNTSVIQDEVLCHRIGLLPLKVDPRPFKFPLTKVIGVNESGVDCDEEPEGDIERNLIFNFNVTCTRNRNAQPTATDPSQLYHNSSVYSKSFIWQPIGDQKETYEGNEPAMVHDEILVAKLRPGQEIEASCHCVKGIGRDHAKFSPVATASYRLLPTIRLQSEITGANARKLQGCFSEGVIELVKKGGKEFAKVKDARRDTCSRNVLRYPELAKDVELGKKKAHFIFSVESTGALEAKELVVEACLVMELKCRSLKAQLEALLQ